jgi:hypothetical protein
MGTTCKTIKHLWGAIEEHGTGKLVITLANAETISINNNNPMWLLSTLYRDTCSEYTHIEAFISDFADVIQDHLVSDVNVHSFGGNSAKASKAKRKMVESDDTLQSLAAVKKFKF